MNTTLKVEVTEYETSFREDVEEILETTSYRDRQLQIVYRAGRLVAKETGEVIRYYGSLSVENASGCGRWVRVGIETLEDIFQLPTEKEIRNALNRAKKLIDTEEENIDLCHRLIPLARVRQFPNLAPASVSDYKVGDVAAVYSRGKDRLGVITKITKTRIEVAYVTPSSIDELGTFGRVTRKSAPIEEVLVEVE